MGPPVLDTTDQAYDSMLGEKVHHGSPARELSMAGAVTCSGEGCEVTWCDAVRAAQPTDSYWGCVHFRHLLKSDLQTIHKVWLQPVKVNFLNNGSTELSGSIPITMHTEV